MSNSPEKAIYEASNILPFPPNHIEDSIKHTRKQNPLLFKF